MEGRRGKKGNAEEYRRGGERGRGQGGRGGERGRGQGGRGGERGRGQGGRGGEHGRGQGGRGGERGRGQGGRGGGREQGEWSRGWEGTREGEQGRGWGGRGGGGRGQGERSRGWEERGRGEEQGGAWGGRGEGEQGGRRGGEQSGDGDRRGGEGAWRQRGGQYKDTRSRSDSSAGKSETTSTPETTVTFVSQDSPVGAKSTSSLSKKEDVVDTTIGLKIPRRKGDGKKGRRVQIEVNHFLLKLTKPSATFVHYDVTFLPLASRKLCRAAVEVFQQVNYPSRFASFDGKKNLYSCGKLPFGDSLEGTVKVYDEENCRDVTFKITMKLASEISMMKLLTFGKNVQQELPQDAIQALDIVLRNPAARSFVPVGRNFFTPQQRIVELGDGLHLWYGFSQSAILGWKPFLNIDVAHKAFKAPESLLEVVANLENDNQGLTEPLSRRTIYNLEYWLKGLKVEYQVPGQANSKRTVKFVKVKDACNRERFERDNGVMMTVGEYFEKEKNYRLRYPYLPCIHLGNENKTNYIPIELCRIPSGQSVEGKLNERQTAQMVRNAAKPPDERKKHIMDSVNSVKFNSDSCINEFGITVSSEFYKVTARLLDSPTLQYRGQGTVRPRLGQWNGEMFLEVSQHLETNWIIVNLDKSLRTVNLGNLEKLLQLAGKDFGLDIGRCDHRFIDPQNNDERLKPDIINFFREIKKANKVKLIVVVMPNIPSTHGRDIYGVVKSAAELAVGILTQCIKGQTVKNPKFNRSVAGNILLKINSKLNGINYTLSPSCLPSIMKEPVMIVGADVTHPPKGDTTPSIAAVAASHSLEAFSYNMIWRIQPPRQEIIDDLAEIMYQQLMIFYKKTNGCRPKKIIFYRDGVSDQQFFKVMRTELCAIRRACKRVGNGQDYEPGITFLVVQKRHHTRFFPLTNDKLKNGNVLPGTVVDTDITHPDESNFYLVSHASIQGTSRPTKYHKLWDDNDISEDDLQELTYYLCHMFARCTRAVSYPAPTYYAHLAAFRAKSYIGRSMIDVSNLQREQEKRTINSDFVKEVPMFFI